MTPNKNIPHPEKQKIKQHPQWAPYSFDFLELKIDQAEED